MIQSLLSAQPEEALSLDEASKSLGVTVATIRNWIKTGYLVQKGRGRICTISIEKFKQETAGTEKLVARANKSLKDSHDHAETKAIFLEKLCGEAIDQESIGTSYEDSLSNSYRNKEGIYYTPKQITEQFFNFLDANDRDKTFCDPCCGSGNFILMALDQGFSPENVYGFDTDPVAVEITKKRIFLKTGYHSENIYCADFLAQIQSNEKRKYDIIYTNPPWGKKIDKGEKQALADILGAGKCQDTCGLFYFASLRCLNDSGKLGLLLPDSFFNVASFEPARRDALDHKIIALLDFGKPFDGLLTKAKGIVLEKSHALDNNLIYCDTRKTKKRGQHLFKSNPKLVLNFGLSEEEAKVISYLYDKNHETLKNKALWGLGIVTGNNKKYVKLTQEEGHVPVYRGSDIGKGNVKKATAFIPRDFSNYQQVAPEKLFLAKEKLLYKFISSKLAFYCDQEQSFCLNSANFLILDGGFPITTRQLSSILNSDLMNWVFQSVFETHKVLRSDIEALPIHVGYFLENDFFEEGSYLEYLNIEKGENGTYRIKG